MKAVVTLKGPEGRVLRELFEIQQRALQEKLHIVVDIPEQDERLDLTIQELGLTGRVEANLLREDIKTVGDLVQLRQINLWMKRGLGKKSVNEILNKLAELGFSLNP